MMNVTRTYLYADFRALGVDPGDRLIVHSSLSVPGRDAALLTTNHPFLGSRGVDWS